MRKSRGRLAGASHSGSREPVRITAKIYGIMAFTTLLTFATLVAGQQLVFPPQQLFA